MSWPSREQLPPQPTPESRQSPWPWLALITVGLGFLLLAFRPPPSSTVNPASSTAPPSGTPASLSFPSPIITMAYAVMTAVAPSPTPLPTPTSAYQTPTMVPQAALCATTTQAGEICTQPPPPPPTPTPMQFCPVLPGEECVSNGGEVIQLATPTAVKRG